MAIEHVLPSKKAALRRIADDIVSATKVVTITGAGISTNCGIPDFRSQGGLYKLIQKEYVTASPQKPKEPASVNGMDLFDASLWRSELGTSVFYKFVASLRRTIRECNVQPSKSHKFLATLRDRRKLVRCYTQNIDGLEERVHLATDMTRGRGSKRRFAKKVVNSPPNASSSHPGSDLYGGCEVVQLHGELQTLRCTYCSGICDWGNQKQHEEAFLNAQAPFCATCSRKDQDRRDRGRRGLAVGSLRPNIVLYGEENPSSDLIYPLVEYDIAVKPDLLLIFGTSLRVHGLKTLVRQFANAVHAPKAGTGKVIFINLSEPSSSVWKDFIDIWVEMDCDAFVEAVREHRPDLFTGQSPIEFTTNKSASIFPASRKRKFTEFNDCVSRVDLELGSRIDGAGEVAVAPPKKKVVAFNNAEDKENVEDSITLSTPKSTGGMNKVLKAQPLHLTKGSKRTCKEGALDDHGQFANEITSRTPRRKKNSDFNIFIDEDEDRHASGKAAVKLLGL